MSKLIPQKDRLLIKPLESEEYNKNGLIIPEMDENKPNMGTVISVGEGRLTEFGTFIEVEFEPGDVVLVPKVGPIKVEYDDEEYIIVQDKEVLLKIDKEEE